MRRPACAALLALLLLPAPARGQATADRARLIFSIGVGQSSGGGQLWYVGAQPIVVAPGISDTIAISRAFRRSLNVVFSGTYFPGPHLGLNAEAQLLGLGTGDGCSIVATIGATLTDDLCRSLNRAKRSATSAAVSAGVVYRVLPDNPIHPYLRANAGFAVTQQSFVKTAGTVSTGNGTADLVVYEDSKGSAVEPYLSFGGGVTAAVARGYQIHFEVRDNYVRVPVVTGPTSRQQLTPPSATVGKHLLTWTLGFDVVLERKRGRRY